MCNNKGRVDFCRFNVLVDGAHIQGLQAVVKLQVVYRITSKGPGDAFNLPQD